MKNIFKNLNLTSDSAVMLTSAHNMRYFSGFSGGEGAVLILNDSAYILVDSRYTGIAMEEALPGFEVAEFSLKSPLLDMIAERLGSAKYLLFEDEYMTEATYRRCSEKLKNIEFIPSSKSIERQRMIKSNEELDYIARAEQIGVDAFRHVLNIIKPGVTEREIAAELEYYMKNNGADGTSFDTIVLSGVRNALPHGMPSDKEIKSGELVLMDFGCKYRGYCSDMTRTVAVGDPDSELKEIYRIVKEAQQIGLNTIKKGITGREADAAARACIENNGYGSYFGHSLGHGVGLMIHELPNLSPKSDTILENNMVVSCEPGIYIYGKGGVRIEDLVVVKDDGIKNLTCLEKDLLIL